jgi:hypothetical protein
LRLSSQLPWPQNDLAGDDTTLVETAAWRKCLMALESIAQRYARAMSSGVRWLSAVGARNAPRLSNRLGIGISNLGRSGL